MRIFILLPLYEVLIIISLCQYDNYLNSIPEIFSGLIGIGAGAVGCILAALTDIAIFFRQSKMLK